MSKIIGIDLGTSNTAAAIREGGKITLIPSAEGSSIGGKAFPSYVAFDKDGNLLASIYLWDNSPVRIHEEWIQLDGSMQETPADESVIPPSVETIIAVWRLFNE